MSGLLPCIVKSRRLSNGCHHDYIRDESNGLISELSQRLQECTKNSDVGGGRCIHDLILRNFLEADSFLVSHLIRLYASCGHLVDADRVFTRTSKPSVYAWSAIISAHARLGNGQHALHLLRVMWGSAVEPDNHVIVAALKACDSSNDLVCCKLIHHLVTEINNQSEGYVESSLMDVYSKGGALEDTYSMFTSLRRPDRVTWGIMIGAYSEHGHCQQALELYNELQQQGAELDSVIFLCTLKACCVVADIEQVRLLHHQIVIHGVETDKSIGNALVATYTKCIGLEEASNMFLSLPKRDVVSWGAIIEGFVQLHKVEDALSLFNEMQGDNIEPDEVVSLSLVKACSIGMDLSQGKLIHSYIIMNGFDTALQIGSAITDMYAKCGSLIDARRIFHSLLHHNTVTLNIMISACTQHGDLQEAACIFQRMLQQNISPNQVTLVCISKVCTGLTKLHLGMLIHGYFIESGFELGSLVFNTLIDMYAKCGSLDEAHSMFDKSSKKDVDTWGVLISGLVQHDHCQDACRCFCQMVCHGLLADGVAFLGALKACSSLRDLHLGKVIHAHVIERCYDSDISVGNTLIDFYGKCGSFEDAQVVFRALGTRDGVTYNAMMTACVHYDHSEVSVELFCQMIKARIVPTQVTFTCILTACASIVALSFGKLIHSYIIEMNVQDDIYITNALVDMYGKCGSPEAAVKAFNQSCVRDVATWNAVIAGFVQHSSYGLAAFYFQNMCAAGFKPDKVTFLSLLSACAHAGLVDEGRHLLRSMKKDYGLAPTGDHFGCVLDLLGRAGCLSEAADLLDSAPCGADLVVQTSLLSHCKERGNLHLGHRCFDQFDELDSSDVAGMSPACMDSGARVDTCTLYVSRHSSCDWIQPE